jgi:putative oxidoreductase
MKKKIVSELYVVLVMLLFLYTATSKILDFDKFVFQMRLAPILLIKPLAPILGWMVPTIELLIVVFLTIGFFYPGFKKIGVYATVILLTTFEIYIITMLLSGSQLPCTCGGIISQMGWKQHLFFNAFFIIGGIIEMKYSKKNNVTTPSKDVTNELKILSRA